jgi:tetratricopeptide (TPR) repeat protein
MSDEPISAPKSIDPTILQRSGWSNAELIWEQIQETAARCIEAENDFEQAAELWQGALDVAREYFSADDPRLATSLVNVALARRRGGDETQARELLAQAEALWNSDAQTWIAALKPEVRARSSMFHLRMERKHKDGYDRLARERYRQLADEGLETIRAYRNGNGGGSDRWSRWRRLKPAAFNDARKLLGAVLLMAGDGR